MWWASLLNTLRPRFLQHSRTARKRMSLCRLTVEALEVRAVPAYAVTDLGWLPGFASSYANALNEAGDIAGCQTTSAGVSHAFFWENGVMTDLGTLGGANSQAYGINDLDQVVGWAETGAVYANGDAIIHAFLWQSGAMTDLGTLAGGVSGAFDINNNGQVVGLADTAAFDDLATPSMPLFWSTRA